MHAKSCFSSADGAPEDNDAGGGFRTGGNRVKKIA
jgi:hypothetical protein